MFSPYPNLANWWHRIGEAGKHPTHTLLRRRREGVADRTDAAARLAQLGSGEGGEPRPLRIRRGRGRVRSVRGRYSPW